MFKRTKKDRDKRLKEFTLNLNSQISSNYLTIKDVFNREYGYPELDPLRDEICKCIICGLNQAAMTLTNHLLEASLKKCLAMSFSIRNKSKDTSLEDAFKEGIKKYDNESLYYTITKANEELLISEKQKTELLEYKDCFRNPYSHATSSEIFKDSRVPGKVITMSEDDKENPNEFIERLFKIELDELLDVKDILPIQGIAQKIVAKNSIVPYFTSVDSTIRDMLKRIKPNS